LARYDQSRIDEFNEWCQAEKITVSGVVAGKQSLNPVSQIAKVDAKWNEMFPTEGQLIPCPLFAHSNDQYGKGLSGTLPQDVVSLKDMPMQLACSRAIIATPNYRDELAAAFMLVDDAWNGCNYMKVDWDGKVQTALDRYRKRLNTYKDDYRAKRSPQDDWLVVTVDYHS